MGDKRQKNQLELAFAAESTGEAPTAAAEGTEAVAASAEPRKPGSLWDS